jgi:hypothetical protein
MSSDSFSPLLSVPYSWTSARTFGQSPENPTMPGADGSPASEMNRPSMVTTSPLGRFGAVARWAGRPRLRISSTRAIENSSANAWPTAFSRSVRALSWTSRAPARGRPGSTSSGATAKSCTTIAAGRGSRCSAIW